MEKQLSLDPHALNQTFFFVPEADPEIVDTGREQLNLSI
jgi:hypothetical protein